MGGELRPKVFISHSTSGDADAEAYLQRLLSGLREWGVEPWRDLERLKPGQAWNDELRLAIQRCDAAILLVTERYLRTGATYARDEALLFAQRAATEAFDDFRLLVLLAPGITPDRLATDQDWVNLEIARRQVIKLASLDPDQVDGLRPTIEALLERYRSGSVPLVLREHYVEKIAEASPAVLAQAADELGLAMVGGDVTPRRFVNVVLAVTPELRRTLDVVERCLQPWREVLGEELRCALARDAVAFTWLDDDTARKVATVIRGVGAQSRSLLVLTTTQDDTVKLHLRRSRKYVAALNDTAAQPGQITREGVIRAICNEVKATRVRREPRDPSTIPAAQLEGLAADLNRAVGSVNPPVVVLGPNLRCDDLLQGLPDLLQGLPELFSNVILVVMAKEDDVDNPDSGYVVLRPQQEREALESLDRVTANE